MSLKLTQQLVNVALVVRQALDFDAPRTVLKASFTVRHGPQAGEQDACERLALSEVFIEEEPRLDRAQAAYGITSPRRCSCSSISRRRTVRRSTSGPRHT